MPLHMPHPMALCRPMVTFSSTVRLENRRMFWNVRAMPIWLTLAVLLPAVSCPSSRMVPRVG